MDIISNAFSFALWAMAIWYFVLRPTAWLLSFIVTGLEVRPDVRRKVRDDSRKNWGAF